LLLHQQHQVFSVVVLLQQQVHLSQVINLIGTSTAAPTTTMFGAPAATTTSPFGTATATAPAATSIFGATQPTTSIFGSAATTSPFGVKPAATQPAFGKLK
jgi:hypothetical protein